jgi:hypothetical protein
VGIAQLAVQYCNVAITTPALQARLFPGVNFSASLFSSPSGVNQVTSALAARVLGTNLTGQPAASTVTTELGTLINALCLSSACNSVARVQAVATAACAAALGSSDVLIN